MSAVSQSPPSNTAKHENLDIDRGFFYLGRQQARRDSTRLVKLREMEK